MDGNNWRPTQGEPSMDGGDWRTQLMPDSRQRNVNEIMETLKRHLPIPGPEGLVELRKIAVRVEEKIYAAATSQSDYLRKICLKMLTIETKSQGGGNNSLSSNPVGNQNPLDAAAASMDSTPQTGHVGVIDWQEEVYQKIKSMKEMFFPELNELYHKIAIKCQQNEVLGTQSKQSDPMDKFKFFKSMLERMITFLQVPKNNISPTHKEKLDQYEKQIIGVINSNRPKKWN